MILCQLHDVTTELCIYIYRCGRPVLVLQVVVRVSVWEGCMCNLNHVARLYVMWHVRVSIHNTGQTVE